MKMQTATPDPLTAESSASSPRREEEVTIDQEFLARTREEIARDWERLVPSVPCD